jgi:hypothetical protein
MGVGETEGDMEWNSGAFGLSDMVAIWQLFSTAFFDFNFLNSYSNPI